MIVPPPPKDKEITFKTFLTNKRAMIAVMSASLGMIFMLFADPILSTYLTKLGVEE